MKITKYIIASFSALALMAGCASNYKRTDLGNQFAAYEYNSISSRYLPRPTFSSIMETETGQVSFVTEVDLYNGKKAQFSVSRENTRENIRILSKFLSWSELATRRQDMLTKEMGKVPAWKNGSIQVYNNYIFHSGSRNEHFLSVSPCAIGNCIENGIYLSEASAIKFRSALELLENGELNTKNLDDVYK